jgi:protein-serine/threonine kinase
MATDRKSADTPLLDSDYGVVAAVLRKGGGPEAGGGPPPQSVLEDSSYLTAESPEKGGGPFPQSSQQQNLLDEPLEKRHDETPAEALFQSLRIEPYEMVYADPPPSFYIPDSPSPQKDQHLLIRNLDTNEYRRLGEGALNRSFLGEYAHPQQLVNSVGIGPGAWASWWAEKRLKDEGLWLAAQSGSLDQLREALEAPADGSPPAEVNSRSLYGRTTLHIAVSVGKPECIELLLDATAEVDARTDAGLTALHIASQRGHVRAASLLLDWGAEVLSGSNDRNLPIHLAAANGHSEVVSLLLERGIELCEQYVSRNNLGQRAAEVSLDIATAETFRHFESRLSCVKGPSGEQNLAIDNYAGRTPYKGSVLLHNARSDVVCRLLHKTQHPPNMAGTVLGSRAESSPMTRTPVRRTTSTKSVRAPFARVRTDTPCMEKVGPDSFVLVERLGKGSFGEVFQVRHKHNEQVYAMKILRKSKIMSGNLLRYALTERNVLSYINHPYIVSLHFAFQTSSYLVLVLQYCPGGNLQHLIERERRLQEPLAKLYSAEILLALGHLHERQIVFRDLKPDNIVIDEEGHSVLTDFGLSKEGVLHLQGTRSFCGSVAFLAPEILQRRGHGHTVDVYGLGVLLFDMLTGLPPFYHPDRETLFTNIKHARLQVPRYVPRPAATLIEALMEREPSRRLGAIQTWDVKGHPFFAGVDFEALMRREVPVPTPPLTNFPRSSSQSSAMYRAGRPDNPFTASPGETRRYGGLSQDVSGWSFAAAGPLPP